MHDEVCALCGKSAERLAVTQGENRYHLECYAFNKRPAPSPTPPPAAP